MVQQAANTSVTHSSLCSSLDQFGRLQVFNMNKLMILILAVCLVSVHAFVKRDTPAADNAASSDVLKAVEDSWKKITENVNAETIKKGFSDTIDNLSKALSSLKPTEEPKP